MIGPFIRPARIAATIPAIVSANPGLKTILSIQWVAGTVIGHYGYEKGETSITQRIMLTPGAVRGLVRCVPPPGRTGSRTMT